MSIFFSLLSHRKKNNLFEEKKNTEKKDEM